jgi:glycosyltransferase involved in cell wall biosynthesis
MNAGTISVGIVCRNEADKLDDCLESVAWADEVLVLDLESEDGSAEIARRRGARVLSHAVVPIVERVRNTVADSVAGEWLLVMDPDERVSPGLANELRLLSARADIDAVEIPFMHFDFGHEPSSPLLRYDPKLRFYRPARLRWPEEPNELPRIARDRLHTIERKDGVAMLHHRNRSISEALERAIRYAPAEAQALVDAGETFSARKMLRRVVEKSRKQYIEGRAFDDGVPGVVRATVLVAFHFWVWVAFWELSGARRTAEDDRYLRRVGTILTAAARARRVVRAPVRAARRLRR